MGQADKNNKITEGGCLCGAVRYRVKGELRGVVNCHCSKCRRFHGSVGSYTAVPEANFEITEDRGLKWFRSVTDETPGVRRGFCSECGSSLFWSAPDRDHAIIAAGSLDDYTGLELAGHIWLEQKAPWMVLNDDLPKRPRGGDSERID